jgi:hypothetical protein
MRGKAMSSSKFDKIKIKLEVEVLAEYEGLVVIGTKINGKFSEKLLYVNTEELDLND